jgi:hypothetical protein
MFCLARQKRDTTRRDTWYRQESHPFCSRTSAASLSYRNATGLVEIFSFKIFSNTD